MDKLSNRVMALEGPDREIFIEAFVAIHGPKPERVHGGSQELTNWLTIFNPFYTLLQAGAWLDAAMSLVPEGYWHGYMTSDVGFTAHCFEQVVDSPYCTASAATPAIALCAAALKSRGL